MGEVAIKDRRAVSQPDAPPSTLLELAMRQGVDLDKVYAIMRAERDAEAQRAFGAAMAAVQPSLPAVLKTRQADRYKHAELGVEVEDLRAPLQSAGLWFTWRTVEQTEKWLKLACVLGHAGGHMTETVLGAPITGPPGSNPAQAVVSTRTYLMRGTLEMALGLAAREDTDGVVRSARPEPAEDVVQGLIADVWGAASREALGDLRGRIQAMPKGAGRDGVLKAYTAKLARFDAPAKGEPEADGSDG